MTHTIIVDRISKSYQIGHSEQFGMLQESLLGWTKRLIKGKRKGSETFWALKDVSWSATAGEVIGIIGRNGAGKSTLLKILSKITYPTSGSVKVNGRVASLLEVGTGFHDELSGRENIFLNGSILGMRRKEVEARLDEIIAFSGVERFIDTPIKRYSSGMRLRLGFAVAAHLDPDILIIDEVLAVGDIAFQKKCLAAMDRLRSGGRTVLFVSHNLGAVENLCSRTIWIDDGQVREDGETSRVVHSYMTEFAGSERSTVQLDTSEGHRGSGEIRYTGIEFLTLDREPQNLIRSGDGVVLRLYFKAHTPVTFPSFGFKLFTELGTLVTETSTWHHGISIPLVPVGDGYIELELDSLNLVPARYVLSLWLTSGETANVVYDCVEHGANIDVEGRDIYESGRRIDSRYGIVFFPQRWKLDGLPKDRAVGVAEHVAD